MMGIITRKLVDDLKHGQFFELQNKTWIHPSDPLVTVIPGNGRIVLPGYILIINVGLMSLMWTVFASENFATQVLVICVVNALLYTLFYCFMKVTV